VVIDQTNEDQVYLRPTIRRWLTAPGHIPNILRITGAIRITGGTALLPAISYAAFGSAPAGLSAAGGRVTGDGAAASIGAMAIVRNWPRATAYNRTTINNIGNRTGNTWQHNPAHRGGVHYGNASVQQRFGSANPVAPAPIAATLATSRLVPQALGLEQHSAARTGIMQQTVRHTGKIPETDRRNGRTRQTVRASGKTRQTATPIAVRRTGIFLSVQTPATALQRIGRPPAVP
jgi:hypothetical protein